MGSFFNVRPVKNYKAGYPVKSFFKKSFVNFTQLKLFSFLVIGLLFFISVPGCGEQVVKTDGVPEPDFDVVSDNETYDADKLLGLPDTEPADFEPNDFDQIDGGAVPECLEDADCNEGYYCDLNSYTCVEQLSGDPVPECLTDEECAEGYYCDLNTYTCQEELAGEPVPECLADEECEEGYYCDLTTYTCIEQLSGDPIPDQEVSDSTPDETEVPDEALSGIAPPEVKI